MRWIVKAGLQKVLSLAPYGEHINGFLQRNVTRGLPRSPALFRAAALRASQQYHCMRAVLSERPVSELRVMEFGAGWDLISPILFYALGVDHQVVLDIHPHLKADLVEDTVLRFSTDRDAIETKIGLRLQRIPPRGVGTHEELERILGIRYLAPCLAQATPFEGGSIDFIHNTSTLEHIPSTEIAEILREASRILRPEGILSCKIDLKDHYSYRDPSIGPYNFLTVSDRLWGFVNSRIHFQNRLRARDYRDVFEESDLEILDWSPVPATAEDLQSLRQARLAERFRSRYSLDELGVRSVHAVLRKPLN